jgi:uncharacterized membrane protein YfhO
LLGVPLPAGLHSVELFYSPPFLYLGAGVSIIAALAFVVLSWRWPRIGLPVAP